MMRTLKIVLTVVSLAVVGAVGCQSDPGKVSKDEMKQVRSAHESLTPGMSKDKALSTFKKGGKYKMSSTTFKGVEIEEYKVEAYHDDDWSKTRDQIVSFLYFADGSLVEVSDSRVDYRENNAVLERWAGAAKPD